MPMSGEFPEQLQRELSQYGQQHVLRWWNDLSAASRQKFQSQIESVDLRQLAALVESRRGKTTTSEKDAVAQRAFRAAPPSSIVRLPGTTGDRDRWEAARHAGEELLKAGKVGAILVAGGQGTRLGFDKPKGMFSIGPVSGACLFQILAEQVLARSRRAGKSIPYYIMTSDATHEETVAYFIERNY